MRAEAAEHRARIDRDHQEALIYHGALILAEEMAEQKKREEFEKMDVKEILTGEVIIRVATTGQVTARQMASQAFWEKTFERLAKGLEKKGLDDLYSQNPERFPEGAEEVLIKSARELSLQAAYNAFDIPEHILEHNRKLEEEKQAERERKAPSKKRARGGMEL